MTAEANKELVRRFFRELFENRNEAVLDEYFAIDCICHRSRASGRSELIRGSEALKEAFRSYFAAFPDVRTTIEDIIAERDRVVVRWTARGTHRGHFFGQAPTNRDFIVTGVTIDRIRDGKVVESWVNWDELGLLQQLELFPTRLETAA